MIRDILNGCTGHIKCRINKNIWFCHNALTTSVPKLSDVGSIAKNAISMVGAKNVIINKKLKNIKCILYDQMAKILLNIQLL